MGIFNRSSNDTIPIWFMRQAGRYLDGYRKIRLSVNSFLDLCYDPVMASTVTLEPIQRFDFDAAIIFSDILVLPHSLGWDVTFEKEVGPVLRQFKSQDDMARFDLRRIGNLQKVYEAINNVRAKLPKDKSLIGFAGAPWTVCSYLLEGGSSKKFISSKKLIYQDRDLVKNLIDFITQHTIQHLLGQIKAGADVLQIFDSWAGMLSGDEYFEFVINPTTHIVEAIKKEYPNIPVIGFPRCSGFLYEDYINRTKIDIIGVDQFVPIDVMAKWSKKIVVQGNLDPITLLSSSELIIKKVNDIMEQLHGKNFIFNLGHGILPETPTDNVQLVIDYVRKFKK
ncbi:MAG: uroporphyrinogen decarboxylase [Rickettsiaceae bacterium]